MNRTPEQILAEFGRELQAARPRRRWRVWLAVTLATTVVAVPTALATPPRVPAPEADVPVTTRPNDAPRPDRTSRPTFIATGKGWKLAASTCTFTGHTTVVLFLTTDTGGAGRRCDALTPEAAAGPVTPPTIYIDPDTHRALCSARCRRTSPASRPSFTASGAPVLSCGHQGPGTFFIAPLPSDARVLNVIGLDARGEPRMHCDPRSCEESR